MSDPSKATTAAAARASKATIAAAVIGVLGITISAMIGFFGNVSVPFINHYFARNTPPQQTQSKATQDAVKPRTKQNQEKQALPPPSNIHNENDSLDDVNQIGQVSGTGNQVNQISGGNSGSIVINPVAPISPHPITFGMGLKWTVDDFAETVRNGNLPAINEYLNPRDGFDPNALWNGDQFVLLLPVFEGTKNFPAILDLFKKTGKLNWDEVNQRSVFTSVYQHPITLQWALLQEAASKNRLADLRALIDAGANPSQLITDEVAVFNRPPHGTVMYKGELTSRTRDLAGADAEQELASFKSIGYALPALEEAMLNASQSPTACAQDIKSRHTIGQAIELAKKPEQAFSGKSLEWDPFQTVVSHLREKMRYGPLAWQGDAVEYARAVATACSQNGTF